MREFHAYPGIALGVARDNDVVAYAIACAECQ